MSVGFADYGEGHLGGMRVAGVQLAASDIAQLAVLLQRARYTDLAQRIGRAVDANWPYVPLTTRDHRPITQALEGIENRRLAKLRDALRDDAGSVHLD